MKIWKIESIINADISVVWDLLNGDLENMQKVMPGIVKNEIIQETEGYVGSTYLQEYKEKKRTLEYVVTCLEYENSENFKRNKIGFCLNNLMEITADYQLSAIEGTTKLVYIATNNPLKWYIKLAFKLMGNNDKVARDFVDRVKKYSEEEK